MTGRAFVTVGLAGAMGIGLAVGLLGRRRGQGLAEVGDVDGGVESLRVMPARWWQKPAPQADRVCYSSKTSALNKFRAWNQAVIDDYGGMTAGGSRGEFDAMTKWGALPRNLAEALWLSLPPERVNYGRGPFCLDQIDVDALNDTSAGRDHPVGFQLPSYLLDVEASRREAEYYRPAPAVRHIAPLQRRARRAIAGRMV